MGNGPEANTYIQEAYGFVLPIQEWGHDALNPKQHGIFDRLIAKNADLEYSFDSEKYIDLLIGVGQKCNIPRRHLFGTQEVGEFNGEKRKRIERAFKSRGRTVLEEHPIVLCAIPVGDSTILAILDGHHRARYSSKFGIHDIPAQVLSLSEFVSIRREYAKREGELTEVLTEDVLARKILHDVSVSIDSFSQRMPNTKTPIPIPGRRSPHELAQLLPAA